MSSARAGDKRYLHDSEIQSGKNNFMVVVNLTQIFPICLEKE